MTLRHRFSLRATAAGSILGLTAGTAAVLGAGAPASAAPVAFDCEVPIVGAKTFDVDMSSSAPATVEPGSTITPEITSVMTVPEDLAGLMRGILSIDEIAGKVWAPGSTIDVLVRDGVVTLNGRVTTEQVREAVRVAAENAPGAVRVWDNLQVADIPVD